VLQVNVCFHCVRLSFFGTVPSACLGRISKMTYIVSSGTSYLNLVNQPMRELEPGQVDTHLILILFIYLCFKLWYEDSVCNTVEENSSIFSMI